MNTNLSLLLRSTAIAAVLVTGTAACGGEEMSGGPCDAKVSTDTKKKPEITIPDCERPAALQTRDIVEGSGEAAKEGDAVAVNYTGISWSTKKQFDSSWGQGAEPIVVEPLGQARVIAGWNQGLVGAKAGGRRLLVIPPDLGYGQQGNGPIAPGETLVFVVDIVSIDSI